MREVGQYRESGSGVRRFAVAITMVAALAGSGAALPAPKQDLDAIRGRIEGLRKDLAETEESRAEAADQLRDSELTISAANRRLRELDQQQQEVERTLAQLTEQAGTSQTGIGRQQTALGRALLHQYLRGHADPIRLLLGNEDPNAVSRRLHYLTYVAKARAQLITNLRQGLAEVERIAAATRGKAEELAAIEQEQNTERQTLQREKADRARVLASVSAQMASQRRQIDTLRRDEERLTSLVDKLAKAAARAAMIKPPKPDAPLANKAVPEIGTDHAAFAQLKGRLRLPVAGELSNRFGSPRVDGQLSSKGVFIRSKEGQEVHVVGSGQVVFADWLRGFGNLLIVDHGDGYMSLYGNSEALFRKPGDDVRTGEVIASVGSSGGSAESGLYFELRYRGKPFDPLSWARLK